MSYETDTTSEVARVLESAALVKEATALRRKAAEHERRMDKLEAEIAGALNDAERERDALRGIAAYLRKIWTDPSKEVREVIDTVEVLTEQAQIAAQEPAGATQGGSDDSQASGGLDGAPATDWSKVEHTADQCQFEECPSCGCCAHGKEHVIGCSTTLDRPLGTECPNTDCACKGGMG